MSAIKRDTSDLAEGDRIAAKLMKQVCEDLNLDSRKENRRGKKDAITRYFF